MAREVGRGRWPLFLRKAEEFLRGAEKAHAGRDWNACVSQAVHAGILACDVMTVGLAGRRNTSEHDDLLDLLSEAMVKRPAALTDARRRLPRLLQVKNVAEYEDRLLDGDDATAALQHARHLVEMARRESATF